MERGGKEQDGDRHTTDGERRESEKSVSGMARSGMGDGAAQRT